MIKRFELLIRNWLSSHDISFTRKDFYSLVSFQSPLALCATQGTQHNESMHTIFRRNTGLLLVYLLSCPHFLM